VKTGRAFLAGVAGAVAMSVVLAAFRVLGVRVSFEDLLGSTLIRQPGVARWLAGLALHLFAGGVTALVYAAGFEYAVQRAGPWVGAGFGLANGLVAGLFMSAIPAMTPLIPESVNSPGAFFQNLSFGPFLFLFLHVVYGAVTGTLYGTPLQRPHPEGHADDGLARSHGMAPTDRR
jgi:hypothetical protein